MDSLLRFGHFEIRFAQRQLLVDGQPVTLGSRAFDLLRVLVEQRERMVSKDELLGLVWPGMIVEENNLQVQISALRKLLGAQVIATIPGRGYQFTANAAEVMAAAPHSSPVRNVAGPRGYLLVADDNKVNRLLLCRTLELLGHHVSSVDDGRKALEKLRRERHDLLLLDLEMPELDGLAVLEQLARDPDLHDLPVIVTSSVEGVTQVARCIELGADDFLHKPVNAELLKARVASSLEKRRLREQQKELIQRLSAAAAAPGAAATANPTAAQRTAATVLAVQLRDAAGDIGVDSETPAASGADATRLRSPQETIELLDNCHTLWRDAVASHGGVIFDGGGNALMAVFGPTEANGAASAKRATEARLAATRAALEMAETMDVFNAERTAGGKPVLVLHIGVASGEVVAGHAGEAPDARLHCVGEPVRRALALQALALAHRHTLLLDSATHSALQGRVATEALSENTSPGSCGAAAVYAAKVS